MKIVILGQVQNTNDWDPLYHQVQKQICNSELYILDKKEEKNLQKFFKKNDISGNVRILFFLRFRAIKSQVKFLQTLQEIVFWDIDACQNYMPESKYYGFWTAFLNQLPWARIICSGYMVSKRLEGEGFDSVFIKKFYNQNVIYDRNVNREVEIGFLGSLESNVYRWRKDFLQDLKVSEGLWVGKASPGEDYAIALSEIKYFVSADIGIGEYMAKAFEAMACGCVVFLYDQGEVENEANGLIDMENVILYKDKRQFLEKLNIVRKDPVLANRISNNGKELAVKEHSFDAAAESAGVVVQSPLRKR